MYVFGCINWSSIFVVNSHGYLQLYVVSSISFIVLISRFFITVKRHHHYGNSHELKKNLIEVVYLQYQKFGPLSSE